MKNVIVVDVRGFSLEKLKKTQDLFFKLGYNWPMGNDGRYWNHEGDEDIEAYNNIAGYLGWSKLRNAKATHTYKQLLKLAGGKVLSDMTSDQLRTKLAKNTQKIVRHQLENEEIVNLLRDRSLAPVPAGTLTTGDLLEGEWWLDSNTEEDKKALLGMGVECQDDTTWGKDSNFGKTYYNTFEDYNKAHRAHNSTKFKGMKQIHRVGSYFFWGAPECEE